MRYAVFYLISRLPFPVLFILSDVMAFLAGKVLGYRKKIILKNLKNSFPDKNEEDLYNLLPGIYLNITDVMIETFKLLTISEAELSRRVRLKNFDVLEKYYHHNKTVVAVTSHICNWEWMLAVCSLHLTAPVDGVYQVIKNSFFNALMQRIRGRFGSIPVEKNEVFRESLKKRHVPHIVALVADQSPPRSDINVYWTKFLNQETVFYNGMERLANVFDWPVVYANMIRLRRGYYELEFKDLEVNAGNAKKGEILEKYVKNLEKNIVENPESWLWSHNRWKRKPDQGS
jgi:Kdo2-lipid IVA lauroyltransferase/acyltransferase